MSNPEVRVYRMMLTFWIRRILTLRRIISQIPTGIMPSEISSIAVMVKEHDLHEKSFAKTLEVVSALL